MGKVFKQTKKKELVTHICSRQHCFNVWQYEIAALMSQIGCITLPSDILHKLYAGVELNPEERRMYEHHPEVGLRLFANIPRMEQVAGMVGLQLAPMSDFEEEASTVEDATICRGAQMLKVAIDYDLLKYQGMTHKAILAKMKGKPGIYNPEILNELEGLKIRGEQGKVVNLKVKDIQTGMVAEEDVFANNGALIIPRGQRVTWPILQGLDVFSKQVGIQEPVCMRMGSSEEDPLPDQ